MRNIALLMPLLIFAAAAVSEHPWDESKADVLRNQEQVVLLHGLGRSRAAMWWLANRLEATGFQVTRIGYSSLTQSPDEIINDITTQIDTCCAHHANVVHFVGHSLGGLLIRAYLQDNPVDNLGRVVMLGTPNQGTQLVDKYRDHRLFSLLGPTTAALGTDAQSLPSRLGPVTYPVGVIAAVADSGGDNADIPGPDDGLVPVESTKLEGMTDFVKVQTTHSRMRYSGEVFQQIVAFLRSSRFLHYDDQGAFPKS